MSLLLCQFSSSYSSFSRFGNWEVRGKFYQITRSELNGLWLFSIYSLNSVLLYLLPFMWLKEMVTTKTGICYLCIGVCVVIAFCWMVLASENEHANGLLSSMLDLFLHPSKQTNTLGKIGIVVTAIIQAFGCINQIFQTLIDPICRCQSSDFSMRGASAEKSKTKIRSTLRMIAREKRRLRVLKEK